MGGQDLPYFKFVTALIDSGLWATMSPGARALYPVLLRHSDRNFKAVFPGTARLLKLTGFKQKSSIRKARQELIDLGLIATAPGYGGRTTYYTFRFDWERGTQAPQGGALSAHRVGHSDASDQGDSAPSGGVSGQPTYNQIHISINNNVPGADLEAALDTLKKRFGSLAVANAVNACGQSGLEVTPANVEKILYRDGPSPKSISWSELIGSLARKVSPGSIRTLEDAFLAETADSIFVSDEISDHLKWILNQSSTRIRFVPPADSEAMRSAAGL
ncbi:MAG: helix-turn-helix domain-containing protein [Spirochaetia bacterium]|nr:helix-turn-helix domain-containing protein [Spirochaetia bacterium]